MSEISINDFFPSQEKKSCKICKKELDPLSASLNRDWHFECNTCEICGKEGLQDTRIGYCIKNEIPLSHLTCYESKKMTELQNREVVITQGHLDTLNRWMGLFWIESEDSPEMELSLDTLVKKTEIDSRLLLDEIRECSFERAAKILTKMQAITAAVSIATSQNKERAKLAIRERDIEKFRKVENYRKDTEKAKEERKLAERETEAQRQQRIEEKANPELKARRKTMEALMKTLGVSEDVARQMTEKPKGGIQ